MSEQQAFKFTEYLDIPPGESRVYQVKEFQTGRYKFARNGDPRLGIKEAEGIRLFYVKAPGEPGVDYVDIGQQTLVAQLLPHLPLWRGVKQRIKITAFGTGNLKRFTVETV